jgi:hypothetical protein
MFSVRGSGERGKSKRRYVLLRLISASNKKGTKNGKTAVGSRTTDLTQNSGKRGLGKNNADEA